ncbi:gustatory receptor 68a-like [Pieris napi]|uniref:gustatory receptor 68a-like n=1 Tax=Pieris napi TaxID=78633 RepID=UPI001FBB962C|nr:gustatory receptor 68a-like [Pieris napi]
MVKPTQTPLNGVTFEILSLSPSIFMTSQFITSLIVPFLFSKQNMIFIKTISEIDSLLGINEEFYSKCKRNTIIKICALVISFSLSTTYELYVNQKMTVMIMAVISFGQKLQTVFFSIYINMITERINVLNNHLRNFTPNKNGIVIKKTSQLYYIGCKVENMSIKSLSIAYSLMSNMIVTINRIFEINIFQTLISTFFYVIIALWTYIYYYRMLKDSTSFVRNLFWCIAELFYLALICCVCEKVVTKRNETKVLVNEIVMNYNFSGDARGQAKTLLEVASAWNWKIIAYGMFEMNITLLLKFVSVATTYLIFLCQVSHLV